MECQHKKVLEWWNSQGPSWRICSNCSYHEQAWHWPGFKKNEDDRGAPTVLNTSQARFINKEEFEKMKR